MYRGNITLSFRSFVYALLAVLSLGPFLSAPKLRFLLENERVESTR